MITNPDLVWARKMQAYADIARELVTFFEKAGSYPKDKITASQLFIARSWAEQLSMDLWHEATRARRISTDVTDADKDVTEQ